MGHSQRVDLVVVRERLVAGAHADTAAACATADVNERRIACLLGTFAVGAAEPEVAADVIEVDVRADDQVRQVLLVDVVGDEIAVVGDTRARVDQHAFVHAQNHVEERILAVRVILNDQPAVHKSNHGPSKQLTQNNEPGVIRQLLCAMRGTTTSGRHGLQLKRC